MHYLGSTCIHEILSEDSASPRFSASHVLTENCYHVLGNAAGSKTPNYWAAPANTTNTGFTIGFCSSHDTNNILVRNSFVRFFCIAPDM